MSLMIGLYETPGGALRFDVTPFVAKSASFSTNTHGPEGLSASCGMALAEAFRTYDQAGTLYAAVSWSGGIVWEGRLEDPTLFAGNDGSGLTISALGSWRALYDVPYTALWSTTRLDSFQPIAIGTSRVPEKWTLTTDNTTLFLAPNKGETFNNDATVGELGMQTPVGGSRTIVGVSFDVEFLAPVNWRFDVTMYNRDFSGTATRYALVGTGAVLNRGVNLTFTGQDRLSFSFFNHTGGAVAKASDTGAEYAKVTNLRIVTATANRVSTTMTVARAPGTNVTCTVGSTTGMYVGQRICVNSTGNPSESVLVLSIGGATTFNATFVGNYGIGSTITALQIYADEIARDMVAATVAVNAAQMSSGTALITSPTADLTDEVLLDVVMADQLARLANLGTSSNLRYEVGVTLGRVLYFRLQGSAARAWYVDATEIQIARTLQDLANSVYAVYTDSNGVQQRTTVSANTTSVTRYGLTRRRAITAQTTSATQAQLIRDTSLVDTGDPKPRATIRFAAVYDANGSRYPLWLVRAGDTITIRNAPPTLSSAIDRIRTFRITHTTYDLLADTLDVEPELPRPTLDVMLARRAEGIHEEVSAGVAHNRRWS